MKNEKLPSQRQLLSMACLAFISPAVRLLPQRTSAVAGTAAWTAPIVAVLPLLGVMWLIRRLAPQGCFDGAVMRAFGRKVGAVVLMAFAAWAVFLASLSLRFYGERFLTTAYTEARIEIFLAAMALFAYLVIRKSVVYFARAGEVYFLLIGAMLVLLLAFAAKDVHPVEVFSVSIADAPGVIRAVWPICSVASTLVFASYIKRERGSDKGYYAFTAAAPGIFMLMNIIIIGTFSAAFVEKLQVPFFTLVKNIKVLRIFERVDALVLAWFVLTDIAFAALMLFAALESVKTALGLKSTSFLALPLSVLIFVLSLLWRDGFQAEFITEKVVHPINIFLGFFLPAIVALTHKLRFGSLSPQYIANFKQNRPQDIENAKKDEKSEKMC